MTDGRIAIAQESAWVTADWLAAIIRNAIETEDHMRDIGAVVVVPPGDSKTIIVLQRGGNHLMVQVNPAEVTI